MRTTNQVMTMIVTMAPMLRSQNKLLYHPLSCSKHHRNSCHLPCPHSLKSKMSCHPLSINSSNSNNLYPKLNQRRWQCLVEAMMMKTMRVNTVSSQQIASHCQSLVPKLKCKPILIVALHSNSNLLKLAEQLRLNLANYLEMTMMKKTIDQEIVIVVIVNMKVQSQNNI